MEGFAERHRVVRCDLRGYGEATLPAGPFSYADDVCALLDHCGIERAAVVGNSFGGKVALELALRRPERVSALVLVDSDLQGQELSPELAAFGDEEDALLEAAQIDEAVELNLRTWLGAVDSATRERVGTMQRRAFELLLEALEREPPPGPVEWLENPPAAGRLGEVRAPTLVVVGSEDISDMQAIADRLTAEIPGARMEVVAGAKHLPAVERPEEFNRIVLGFLAGGNEL